VLQEKKKSIVHNTINEEAMQGPNAKEWQKVLNYKISQLEKLRT
jgi:hypothetical protein